MPRRRTAGPQGYRGALNRSGIKAGHMMMLVVCGGIVDGHGLPQ